METKKKIFFLLYSMNIGGVEKSLVNLLSIIPREKYNVHVGLIHLEGGMLPLLPSDITIHHVTDISRHWQELKNPPMVSIMHYVSEGRWIKALWAFFVYLICKIQGSFLLWVKYLLEDSQGIEETFDVAIAYAGPSSDIDYYVCNKIKAKKKFSWIHFDIDKVNHDVRLINKLYISYQGIIVVSDSCKQKIESSFPHFREKMMTFNNVISPQLIRLQANGGATFDNNLKSRKILTVGRISKEKGQMLAIDALKLLKDKGYDVVWYFIGDGKDKHACEEKVIQMGLKDSAIFLGALVNPYGYMRDCDVYVQPSRYEGYCVTILEALCFSAPIVATNFTSIEEQLNNRNNSFIVNMDADSLANGIIRALSASEVLHNSDNINIDIHKLLDFIA